jgi:hypothetical protein
MNVDSRGRGRGGRSGRMWRWWSPAGVLVIVAGLAMLASGCGSGLSPSRASYSACMRKHGVRGVLAAPLPTPLSTPSRRTSAQIPAKGAQIPAKGAQIPAKDSAAMQACRSLLPGPGRGSGQG